MRQKKIKSWWASPKWQLNTLRSWKVLSIRSRTVQKQLRCKTWGKCLRNWNSLITSSRWSFQNCHYVRRILSIWIFEAILKDSTSRKEPMKKTRTPSVKSKSSHLEKCLQEKIRTISQGLTRRINTRKKKLILYLKIRVNYLWELNKENNSSTMMMLSPMMDIYELIFLLQLI